MKEEVFPSFLEVKNLKISFPKKENFKNETKNKPPVNFSMAVNGISFNLFKGETLGIVGESGSGKSLTAMAILGIVDTQAKIQGEIYFGKLNLIKLSNKDLRKIRGSRISMIFQEPMSSLNPVITCGEQVSEVLRFHRSMHYDEAKKECLRLFDEVELPNPERIWSAYPYELSGGQKQRVMIAMALSTNPEILIADEPTTALDVTVQKTIVDLLKRLKEVRGMSMLFISHDLGLVGSLANRIMVMYRGDIVETGLAKDILFAPQHPYTKGLLACRPQENQGSTRLPILSDFMEIGPSGEILEKHQSLRQDPIGHEEVGKNEIQHRKDKLYLKDPLLSIKHLTKKFKNTTILDNLSFDIYPGETLGLVGESGSGKTTLGRTLLRLLEPDEGEIFFKGRDLIKFSRQSMREARKKIQIIFQDPYSSLNPRQTIGQTLLEPLNIFKIGRNLSERKEMVYALLEKVQLLPSFFNRYPHEFSGGQRQRIGIARTLSVSPEFIVCDESVSALDVSIQAQIINLLISLQKQYNLTLLFISHDLSVVRFIADRMMVLNKGKIEEIGTPDEIYFNPRSAFTKRLIEAIPKF